MSFLQLITFQIHFCLSVAEWPCIPKSVGIGLIRFVYA